MGVTQEDKFAATNAEACPSAGESRRKVHSRFLEHIRQRLEAETIRASETKERPLCIAVRRDTVDRQAMVKPECQGV